MEIQFLIVLIIIAAAGIFLARSVLQKVKAFSHKENCGNDCGCGK